MFGLPIRRALPLLLAAPLLLTITSPAAGTPSATASSAAGAHPPRWDVVRPSVHTAPAVLLGRVATTEPVRVASVRIVGGRPDIKVATVHGRAAAISAITSAQQAPAAVAVRIDRKMRVAPEETTSATGTPSLVAASTPPSNDAYRSLQWALDTLNAESLWTQQPGKGVIVAVVDTGVAGNHPDLAGRVVTGTDYVTAGGNGFADGNGHGTHVAGIIAATANNSLGVAGLAQGVKVMAIRALGDDGSGWGSDVSQGIVYATDHGASAINLSLGGGEDDVTRTAVAYAVSHNVVVAAAAGNQRAEGNPVSYPAAYPDVIGVAASDDTNEIADFSNTGAYVDVTAPGVDIASTYPPSSYAYLSGTSMATPFVAAAAGLLKAADPTLTPARITSALETSAVDLRTPGRDDYSGYGLINPSAALCVITGCGTTPVPAGTTPPPPSPAPAPLPQLPAPVTAAPLPQITRTATRMLTRPATVAYGGTVSGGVQVLHAATSLGVAHTPVQVCARNALATHVSCQQGTTDANGRYLYRLAARANVTVYAVHPATTSTTRSVSASFAGKVTAAVKVSRRHAKVTVTVSPHARQYVTLQQWKRSRWLPRARTRASTSGTVTFSRLARAGYRVIVPASRTLTATQTVRFAVS
jgi:serine protease